MSGLILASASPRRRDLLHQIGIVPTAIREPGIDETPKPRELPRPLSLRLAQAKARSVQAGLEPEFAKHFILAADTVVACGRRCLPKAEDEATARNCLTLLSGRRHQVLSAFSIIGPDGRNVTRCVLSRVAFKRLTNAEIDAYLASGEWHGKAGGYAIQGLASAYIHHIEGSYSGVVGLPLHEVAMTLEGLGFTR